MATTGRPPDPATLVLLRHGQSTWNLENLFTGWHDVPLSERGVEEAREAGRQLTQAGLQPDIVHTSVLIRAIQTADERHYGALQGLNKKETSERYGADQVKLWRRSYDVRPPALESGDDMHPARDARYAALPPELLPSSECLQDVVARMLPYWYDSIVPDLLTYSCVLISAHGNSLRALVKHLDGLSEQEVVDLDIPTGVPRVYNLRADFSVGSWRYLGDPVEIERRAAEVKSQAR